MDHKAMMTYGFIDELRAYTQRLRELIASDPVGRIIRIQALEQAERRIQQLEDAAQ